MHGNPPWRSNPSIPYTSQKTPTHPKRGHNLSTSALKKAPPHLGVIEQCCCKVIKGQVIATGEGFLRTRLMFSDSSGDPWGKKTTALKIPEWYGIVKLLIETIVVLLFVAFGLGRCKRKQLALWLVISTTDTGCLMKNFQGNHIINYSFFSLHTCCCGSYNNQNKYGFKPRAGLAKKQGSWHFWL